jgi:hypothetical protein
MNNEPSPLKKSADMMYGALQVFIRSEKLRPLLAVNDPKALEQAIWACSFYASNFPPEKPVV